MHKAYIKKFVHKIQVGTDKTCACLYTDTYTI